MALSRRRGRRVLASLVVAAVGVPLALQFASPGSAAVDPACPWVGSASSPDVKAAQVLARMTQDEKFQVITASRPPTGIPRLCIPGVYQQGGPGGVNQTVKGVTQLPAPLGLAATFDTGLAEQYGAVIGAEERAKGVSMVGAPTLNIDRTPLHGRNYETYGEDPALAGALGASTIQGIQSQDIIAMVKHYAVYNQQTNRFTLNATVDERVIREIYLPAFEDAIKNGGANAVMCSYTSINGEAACGNDWLLNDVLKGDWSFPGVVAPDWGAHTRHNLTAEQVANGGLDYEIPSANVFNTPLRNAVANGQVSQARLDEMAFRALRAIFAAGLVDNPVGTAQPVATTPENQAVGRATAEQGTVLLKNDKDVLPLRNQTRNIAVFGPGASTYPITTGGPSAGVAADSIVTPLDGIKSRAGSSASVRYLEGVEPVTPHNALLPGLPNVPQSTLTTPDGKPGLQGAYFNGDATTPVATRVDRSVNFDWAQGRALGLYPNGQNPPPAGTNRQEWTGTFTAPGNGNYTFDITATGATQVTVDGVQVASVTPTGGAAQTQSWTAKLKAGSTHTVKISSRIANSGQIKFGWQPPKGVVDPEVASAARAAKDADVAIVFATDWGTEWNDRPALNLPGNQDALIAAVAKANKNTIVVLNTGGPVLMPWVDDARAILEGWYAGQSAGTAIASVLWGDTDPAGRLPITFPARADKTPTSDPARFPGIGDEVSYGEGLQVGYRWYDAQQVKPLFPFGHGLSYTDFKLRDLQVTNLPGEGNVAVNVDVTNTGKRTGTQVVQLYLTTPASAGEPPRQLRAFAKVTLGPGKTEQVAMTLDPRDFAYWNSDADTWQVDPGRYTVKVGTSSRDLPLSAQVTVKSRLTLPASSPVN
ncbi:glycoside hydrolase family 3 C-terminal domain-containing protein [Phytohabitans sp. ZYX-F-186]|uniref:Glycoside hydrolase family 3 C-terminal domain-containing protein n=1 Tax=Phytohabitans maris TaxID=3071409 RepID=A0ABU0Z9G2_9ACTN|nr:glycoside hydrolase family 3 C-terminal domain-containing protein [Phytohabitans sp. ZYX-F-186]MDQ7903685.1 glycoside hydrolase family 3 C-terminal domain-containing protein [Phytohabitans sp. ZYX-F-186]